MAPPAPGLLSTTTGTLICLLSASASNRMLMSLPPPGGQATIKVIGSEGNVCACTPGAAATMPASAKPRAAKVAKILRFISRLRRERLRVREFSHDIEREQAVLRTAQQSEDRFVYS